MMAEFVRVIIPLINPECKPSRLSRRQSVMARRRRHRYRRRARVSARMPGCGCCGISIPLFIGMAAAIVALIVR
jgi:hypothetical protein